MSTATLYQAFSLDDFTIDTEQNRLSVIAGGVAQLLLMDYNEFKERWESYKDSFPWRRLRYKRKVEANFVCEGCHTDKYKLEMHHDHYPYFPFTVFDCVENVRVLCRECHEKFYQDNKSHYPSKSFFIEMQVSCRDYKPPEGLVFKTFVRF
jgi:hypothetical protein